MFRFKITFVYFYWLLFYVSIHPMFRFKPNFVLIIQTTNFLFQYILCFGSRTYNSICLCASNSVSIHPMFRFKGGLEVREIKPIQVSIHPMFRFKKKQTKASKKLGKVSIHPMFRFKTDKKVFRVDVFAFQYILCFGSSKWTYFKWKDECKVSIHPMFRFKQLFSKLFIFCLNVSIHPMFRFK